MSMPLWTRRRLLTTAVGSAVALRLAPALARAEPPVSEPAVRWLELTNTHTGEVVSVPFRGPNGYSAEAIAKLEHVLRDHRANVAHPMDPGLYDLLSDLACNRNCDPRFEIISGYRSPNTNAALRSRSEGVAKHSLHMEGRAIDVRLKGCSCADLRDLALAARRGGVGYYQRSDFVHVDTGRVRAWLG